MTSRSEPKYSAPSRAGQDAAAMQSRTPDGCGYSGASLYSGLITATWRSRQHRVPPVVFLGLFLFASPTGKLGFDTTGAAGFDIYSILRNGVSVGNQAFLSLTTAEGASFFTVNLLTGRASWRGSFGDDKVIDIALPLNQR